MQGFQPCIFNSSFKRKSAKYIIFTPSILPVDNSSKVTTYFE